MKKLLFALVILALALPAAAQVNPVWTAAASTGAIDESSLGLYSTNFTSLTYLAGSPSLNRVVARYNVTNLDGTVNPLWNTLELGYFDNSPSGSVTATLFQANNCSGAVTLLCSVTSTDASTNSCIRCPFTAPFDFTKNVYWVEVSISRSSAAVSPQALSVRLYRP